MNAHQRRSAYRRWVREAQPLADSFVWGENFYRKQVDRPPLDPSEEKNLRNFTLGHLWSARRQFIKGTIAIRKRQ